MMSIVRRWGRLAFLLPLVFMTACAKDAPQDFLQPEGKFAKKIDALWDPVFLIAVVVSAWYGGFGPATLAVCLSWVAIDRFVLESGG